MHMRVQVQMKMQMQIKRQMQMQMHMHVHMHEMYGLNLGGPIWESKQKRSFICNTDEGINAASKSALRFNIPLR